MPKAQASDIKREVQDLIKSHLPNILRTALKLMDEPTLASNSRVQLIGILFRAGGMFENVDEASNKEPHQMTAEEIERTIKQLENSVTGRLQDDIFE